MLNSIEFMSLLQGLIRAKLMETKIKKIGKGDTEMHKLHRIIWEWKVVGLLWSNDLK